MLVSRGAYTFPSPVKEGFVNGGGGGGEPRKKSSNVVNGMSDGALHLTLRQAGGKTADEIATSISHMTSKKYHAHDGARTETHTHTDIQTDTGARVLIVYSNATVYDKN